MVLGFDRNKAYADTGVSAREIAPIGGPGNPMFWVARAKMSREPARLPKEKLLAYIVELKSFSGNANLADMVERAILTPWCGTSNLLHEKGPQGEPSGRPGRDRRLTRS